MKKIPLSSKKYPGLVALVDDEAFGALSVFKWSPQKTPRSVYAVRNQVIGGRKTRVYMHRSIMLSELSAIFFEVDHINSDGLDNRRSNLRLVTRAQNQMNRRSYRKGRLKGAYKIPGRRAWKASISMFGYTHYLGQFKTEEDAHIAYCKAAKNLFGQFSRHH